MSLLQNTVCFIGLFCKRDLYFKEPTDRSHPMGEAVKIVYRASSSVNRSLLGVNTSLLGVHLALLGEDLKRYMMYASCV